MGIATYPLSRCRNTNFFQGCDGALLRFFLRNREMFNDGFYQLLYRVPRERIAKNRKPYFEELANAAVS